MSLTTMEDYYGLLAASPRAAELLTAFHLPKKPSLAATGRQSQ